MKTVRLKSLVASLKNGAWGDEPENDDDGTYCVRAADFLLGDDEWGARWIADHRAKQAAAAAG